jgi:uncharacterized membrane protein YgaE (UPF0421/DUF939 family)
MIGGMSMSAALRSARRPSFLQMAKSAIATMAAWLLAGWLVPGPPPVFAAIAALLVVQPSINQSLTKGVERTVGVVVGVLVASLLGVAFGNGTWVILAAIVAALLLVWLLRMTPGTGNQVVISAILVLALGTASASYAMDRVIETLLGAVVGIVVNVAIVPPVAIGPAQRAMQAVGSELAASMERLSAAAGAPQSAAELADVLARARGLRPLLTDAEQAIAAAEESLALNPRARRHRDQLAEYRTTLDRFGPIATQVIGMTRAFTDRYDASVSTEPAMGAIAEQLTRAAHDVRLVLDRADPTAAGAPTEPPALTRPLAIGVPTSDHWVLIGSLLVDLERIHAALVELAGEATAHRDAR